MGTRGCWGFYQEKQEKVAYNNSDSYPSFLGNKILKFIQEQKIEGLKNINDNLQLIKEEDLEKIIDNQTICKVEQFLPLSSQFKENLTYQALSEEINDQLVLINQGFPILYDSYDFLFDSLFCEYAYIINLDNQTLEFYRGFNKQRIPNAIGGRYSNKTYDRAREYFGIILLKEYPLLQIINQPNLDSIVREMEKIREINLDQFIAQKKNEIEINKTKKKIDKKLKVSQSLNHHKL